MFHYIFTALWLILQSQDATLCYPPCLSIWLYIHLSYVETQELPKKFLCSVVLCILLALYKCYICFKPEYN